MDVEIDGLVFDLYDRAGVERELVLSAIRNTQSRAL